MRRIVFLVLGFVVAWLIVLVTKVMSLSAEVENLKLSLTQRAEPPPPRGPPVHAPAVGENDDDESDNDDDDNESVVSGKSESTSSSSSSELNGEVYDQEPYLEYDNENAQVIPSELMTHALQRAMHMPMCPSDASSNGVVQEVEGPP